MEITTVTVRDLARNTAEILERVAAGERVKITLDGEAVAIVTAPDLAEETVPVEETVPDLVEAGIVADWPPDGPRRHLRQKRRRLEPGNRPLSELIIEMLDEERARANCAIPRHHDTARP